MAKKIYDIVPRDTVIVDQKIQTEPVTYKRKNKFSSLLIIIFLILIIGFTGAYFIFPANADVIIAPKIDDATYDASVVIDSNQSIIDYNNNIIPGIIFNGDNNKVYSEDFQSTGTSTNVPRAAGTIRVYNKTTKPLSLVKNTGFLSNPGGLIYRADAAFTIPAAKGDGTPGSVDVKVTATEAGTIYNIKTATFSVPKLSGTEYYINVYAETIADKAISGGEDASVKIVSKDDINSSRDSFQTKYTNQAKTDLMQSVPQGYEYFSDDIVPQVNNLVINAKQGDQVNSFNISSKVTSSVLVFRKEDINKLGESLLLKDSEKVIVPDSITYEVTGKSIKNGKLNLNISFKARTYLAPDTNFVSTSIKGKDKDYALSVLKNIPELNNYNIKLSPFWQMNIPENPKAINIEVNLK